MRAFLRRLVDAFRRKRIAREFDDEMAFHLEQLAAEYRRRGLSEADARDAAQREFGNPLRTREALQEQAGFRAWDEVVMDLRHACRALARRPMLTFSVIGILTIGLGSAATIHGLIDAVFLRPLPVSHPEQLYSLECSDPTVRRAVSWGTAHRLEQQLPAGSVAAYSGGNRCTVEVNNQPAVRANTRLVNGAFFQTLAIPAAAGRLLQVGDDTLNHPAHVVVCSYVWAEKNFGRAADAVGREITVNRLPITVVGVLPKSFRDVAVGQLTELWLPTALQLPLHTWGNASVAEGDDRRNDPDWTHEERITWLQLLVRVRPGQLALADRELDRAWAIQRGELLSCANDDRERENVRHRRWTLVSSPRGDSRFRGAFRVTGMLLAGVVGVMLVLVSTNVSGLLLVRAMSRQREVGVRLALGGGIIRVLRPAVMETLVMAVIGGIGGLVVAEWLLPAAARLVAPGQDLDLALGWRSVAVMSGLVLITSIASALAPSVWIARLQPLRALAGQRGIVGAPLKLGRMLVVAQFALAVALVAVATTLGQEVQRALSYDPGFNREHVVTAVFDPESAGYEDAAVLGMIERLRAAALAIPGVKAVTFAANGILAGSQTTSGLYFRGGAARIAGGEFQHDAVAPGFFSTMGVKLLAGREFAMTDSATSQPVVLVSAAFARRVFGEANPVGQTFGFDAKPTARDWTVVGVVADVRVNGVRQAIPPMFYTASAQTETHGVHFIAVRFEGPAAPVQAALRAELARTEPALVFSPWKTMESRMADDLGSEVATTRLATIFGCCAMLLAAAGIAGSLGYLVVLRQRDLALRMAVGADPRDLVRGVLADALRLSLAGAVVGIATVWAAPMLPLIESMLHGRLGWQPAVGAIVVAGIAAALASIGPARRASRIDPMLVLKAE